MFGARERAIFELARRQEGVVGYSQLASLGITQAMLHHRMVSGEWTRELPSVARMYWAEPTWLQRTWAAFLWAGPSSLIAHRTAAVLLGLDCPAREPIEVCCFSAESPAPWVRICRNRGWQACSPQRTVGIAHTDGVATLFHLGEDMSERELTRVVASAIRHRIVALESLRSALAKRQTFRGSTGAVRLRRVVQDFVRPDRKRG